VSKFGIIRCPAGAIQFILEGEAGLFLEPDRHGTSREGVGMPSETLISLHAGTARLRVAAGIGGSIVDWLVDGLPVLRPPSASDLAECNPRLLGSYPLVPYQNRIAGGAFSWAGRDHQLPHNFGDKPYAIHGVGWQRAWQVASAADDEAILALDHDPAMHSGWPFRFRANQRFRLSPGSLEVTTSVENTDCLPWPAGLGHHPYFPRTRQTTLQFDAEAVWLSGADEMPTGRVPVPDRWNCRTARPVCDLRVDHCFAGWRQPARIHWPEQRRSLDISADPAFGHLIVFVPEGRDYFCVEPVTHMSDAIHWLDRRDDTGLKLLAPGEKLEGTIQFDLLPA